MPTFKNHTLNVKLFSQRNVIMQEQNYSASNDGTFKGSFQIPNRPFPTHEDNIFNTGAGGNLVSWQNQQRDAQSPEAKTVVGFIISLLRRDIGVTGHRQAGIDQYFEPSKLFLKKQLGIYDLSSPRLKQIYFISLKEDSTGFTYNFTPILGTSDAVNQAPDKQAGGLLIHVNRMSHLIDDLPAQS